MRRRTQHEEHADSHRWIVSYADFITLLFAFFTTLYAISSVDAKKLSEMVASMQAAFATNARGGDKQGGVAVPLLMAAKLDPTAERTDSSQPKPMARQAVAAGGAGEGEISLEDVRERLRERLKEALEEGRLSVDLDRRGLVVSIREAGFFATGSADLTPSTCQVISEIADAISDIGNFVRVEGHTDNVPIHTGRFASNWELSTARATTVVAFLIREAGLEAVRLSAAGYSEYHPVAPNDSDENRARNRRVDIVILNPATIAAEEPHGGVATEEQPANDSDTQSPPAAETKGEGG